MIDANLLRQLGWSEQLINEVTRIAGAIREDIGNRLSVGELGSDQRYGSGTQLFFEVPEIDTGTVLAVTNPISSGERRPTMSSTGRAKTARR